MNTDYRYQLDSPRVTGRRQEKTTCPRCGRQRCLVRYVDTHDHCRYLADEVGRCDHEQSCGYHYRPQDYFRDHAHLLCPSPHRPLSPRQAPVVPIPASAALVPLPWALVARSHSPHSTFWYWLVQLATTRLGVPPERLQQVYEDYHIGATRRGEVVFWQIDERQRVRSGNIIEYASNGRRTGRQDWVHSRLQRRGQLPQGFALSQCLFGAHLLPGHPQTDVCLVESQKTALLMALLFPQSLWLATCGCHGLKPERLACLQGRHVTLFPDSGCYDKWCRIMDTTEGLHYAVSRHLEAYPPNTDLADLAVIES